MSEKWTGESKEKEYLIENEGGFFRAIKFANNPVTFLSELREYYISENYSEADFATQAISEIFELEVIIANENIVVTDNRLSAFLAAESQSEAWAVNLFSLLKNGGYTKEEISRYIALDDPEFSNEERLQERSLNVYVNKVYAE